jgi:T-complex protein 1 subunit delta
MKAGASRGGSAPSTQNNSGPRITGSEKQRDTRMNNIIAAKAVSDVVRTSLGPRGMDKMVSRVFVQIYSRILQS